LSWPRITVVTPSLNQGAFLEETILSVLGQAYPNLEYIVLDGGSTDNSVETIQKYEGSISHWVSEPDHGQSAAINKGFQLATGEILAWLNSDDMYMMGALSHAASTIELGRPAVLFGNALHFSNETGTARGSNVEEAHGRRRLALSDYLIQPSVFWTREAWSETGQLNESLTFAFDWDWFIRAQRAGVAFRPTSTYLSLYRLHEGHKTGRGGEPRASELAWIYDTYSGKHYARAFSEVRSRSGRVGVTRRLIRRLRLRRVEHLLLKLSAPRLFRGIKSDDVRDMLTMSW
jgi:glycosyltransferase involved in cell wall biosynthesis